MVIFEPNAMTPRLQVPKLVDLGKSHPNTQTSVDVIVPCYNYGRYLRECIESVISQEGAGVRVLIIDDASSDETQSIGSELAKRDSRIEYRRHPSNRGHIETYNEGLQWVDSEFLLLLSADDALYRDALKTATGIMAAHPEIGFVFGKAFDGQRMQDCPLIDSQDTNVYRTIQASEFLNHCCANAHNPVPTPSAIIRSSVQKRIGNYRHDLPHTADLEMWMRLAADGQVGISRSVLAFHRKHSNNMTYQHQRPGIGDLIECHKAIDSFCDTHADPSLNVSQLRDMGRKAVAWRAFWSASCQLELGNLTLCSSCLDLSRSMFPAIANTHQWRKMRLKRLLGSRIFKARSFFRRMQKTKVLSEPLFDQKIVGWWPLSEQSR
jgi:GT2 family glycosyltransferase